MTPQTGPQHTLRRIIGSKGKEKFRAWIKHWGKSFVPRPDSIAEDAARFRNDMRDQYNVCFPQRKVKIRKIDEKKPWLNDPELIGLIKERDKLYARNLKQPGGLLQTDLDRLQAFSADVNKRRKDMKKSFFAERLGEAGKDAKKAWSVIHGFTGKQQKNNISCRTFEDGGASITGDQAIADSSRVFS